MNLLCVPKLNPGIEGLIWRHQCSLPVAVEGQIRRGKTTGIRS